MELLVRVYITALAICQVGHLPHNLHFEWVAWVWVLSYMAVLQHHWCLPVKQKKTVIFRKKLWLLVCDCSQNKVTLKL